MLYDRQHGGHKGNERMKTFNLYLYSSTQFEQFNNVTSFIGEDSSGSFGVLSGHARMITCLKYGLARIRYDQNKEEYIAVPGGILYFADNTLKIAVRYYFRHDDYLKIAAELDKQLSTEETDIVNIRETLHRLDENVLRRLWELKREGKYGITE